MEVEGVNLETRAARIRQLQADVQRGIIKIGFELLAAKKEIGHGGWADWLQNEFDWTQQTANRFMRVAERFGKLNNVVQFKPSTLQTMLLLPKATRKLLSRHNLKLAIRSKINLRGKCKPPSNSGRRIRRKKVHRHSMK